jgi:hypothetical protein
MTESSIFLPLAELKRASSSRLRTTPAHKITTVAVIICTAGWSLLWAQALSVLDLVPQWLCAASLFAGTALIPFCRMLANKQSESGSRNSKAILEQETGGTRISS